MSHADGLDGEARAELLESLSLALHLLNELADAYEACREAVALRRAAGDSEMLATDLSFLSLVAWVYSTARSRGARPARRSPSSSRSATARRSRMAYAALGRMGLSAGGGDGGRAASERALEIGRRVDDPEAVATALATIGTLELNEGNDAGQARLEESLRIGREAGLPVVVDRAINNLGYTAPRGATCGRPARTSPSSRSTASDPRSNAAASTPGARRDRVRRRASWTPRSVMPGRPSLRRGPIPSIARWR